MGEQGGGELFSERDDLVMREGRDLADDGDGVEEIAEMIDGFVDVGRELFAEVGVFHQFFCCLLVLVAQFFDHLLHLAALFAYGAFGCGKQLIGDSTHRGDDDTGLLALVDLGLDDAADGGDHRGGAHRGAAEFHRDHAGSNRKG